MAQTRKRPPRKRIGRPFGRPFLYRFGMKDKGDITPRGCGNSSLLDVTVPTDTEGVKPLEKPGLDREQIIHYWETLKVVTLIIIFIVVVALLELFTGNDGDY